MRPKLTVVVACTGRKSAPATRECLVRHLPELSLAERHDIWRHRLDENLDKMPVSDLYAGDAWRRTEAVLAAAASAGFEPTLFVASAGLGLVEASTLAPAYGATFTAEIGLPVWVSLVPQMNPVIFFSYFWNGAAGPSMNGLSPGPLTACAVACPVA